MNARTLPLALCAAALLAAPLPAAAAGGVDASRAAVALIPGWTEADGARIAAVRLDLAPGWKTYWRNPGDAGIPPRFDWSGSDNVASVEVIWPRPHAFEFFGIRTLGYKGEVTLPLRVIPEDPAHSATLRLSVDFGVCSDVCVPETAALSTELPAAATAAAASPRIAEALSKRILAGPASGLAVERCTIAGAGAQRRFEGVFRTARPFDATPVAVIEAGDEVWFAPAEVRIENGAVLVEAAMETASPDLWVGRDAVSVTLLGEDQAFAAPRCGN